MEINDSGIWHELKFYDLTAPQPSTEDVPVEILPSDTGSKPTQNESDPVSVEITEEAEVWHFNFDFFFSLSLSTNFFLPGILLLPAITLFWRMDFLKLKKLLA